MNEELTEPVPGTGNTEKPVPDTDVEALLRRWRKESAEEPSTSIDQRIRAAAHRSISSPTPRDSATAHPVPTWRRFAPLAAAASVALLAVGLARLVPREEYQATPKQEARVPAPDATRAEQANEPYSTAPPDAETVPEQSRSPEPPPASKPRAEPAASPPPAVLRADEEHGGLGTRSSAGDDSESVAQAKATDAPARAAGATEATSAIAPAAARGADFSRGPALPAELAAKVQSDAARRTGLAPGSILVVAVDPVAWLDASLGCGAAHTSAPEERVPGYVVTVRAEARTLRYHTDASDQIRICEDE